MKFRRALRPQILLIVLVLVAVRYASGKRLVLRGYKVLLRQGQSLTFAVRFVHSAICGALSTDMAFI
jgi:hypothetical protein